jgi:hypothetical protein
MKCHPFCPVHKRSARRRMARFLADVEAEGHIQWARNLLWKEVTP